MRRGRVGIVDDGGRPRHRRRPAEGAGEQCGGETGADDPGACGAGDDGRERHVEDGEGDEGSNGDHPQYAVLQRAPADAPGGVGDDGDHRWLDAVEDPGDQRCLAQREVGPGEDDDQQERGQDEQGACDDPPGRAVEQPAEVGGELLRFRAGQQHAVVERVQETALGDPAPALDQFLVHQRDLAGWPAEPDAAELRPEA